jgi:P2 family phage contractile tail tube protein
MNQNYIPEAINNFNVYWGDAHRLVGISGEVELPDFEALTETLQGSGIAGEVDDPITGHFKAMQMKIPFSNLFDSIDPLLNTTEALLITLRGSLQVTDKSTNATDYIPVKVVLRGKCVKYTPGKVDAGKKTEAEIQLEVAYIKIAINKVAQVELDKLNMIYKIDGKDLLDKVKSQI